MKNKTKTYILLIVVLGIWGTIGFKIFSAFNPESPGADEETFEVSFTPETVSQAEAFTVETVDRDPFLGTLTVKRSTGSSKRRADTKTFNWIPIQYQGVVKRQNSKQEIFIVNINGKQHLMRKGQEIDSVTLISGSAKQITVTYKKHRKTVDAQ